MVPRLLLPHRILRGEWLEFQVTPMPSNSEPGPPRNRDQQLPVRKGELIDDASKEKRDRDQVPDTPPSEPQPPVKELPQGSEREGASPNWNAPCEASYQ